MSDLTVKIADTNLLLSDFTERAEQQLYFYDFEYEGTTTLNISSTGYKTQTLEVTDGKYYYITLEKETPIYIDNIQTEDGKVYKLRTKTSELINDSGFVSNLSFYIVEMKLPTTDDPTWYKVYSNGWCEQGGTEVFDSTESRVANITLPKPLNSTDYQIFLMGFGSQGALGIRVSAQTETGFTYAQSTADNNYRGTKIYWRAEGIISK